MSGDLRKSTVIFRVHACTDLSGNWHLQFMKRCANHTNAELELEKIAQEGDKGPFVILDFWEKQP